MTKEGGENEVIWDVENAYFEPGGEQLKVVSGAGRGGGVDMRLNCSRRY